MKLILHTVVVKAPRETVYLAVATRDGLAGWWTTNVSGESAIGETISFQFADVFSPDMLVLGLVPNEKVTWRCIGGEKDWIDNLFTFEVIADNGTTTLLFRQEYSRELDDRTYGAFNYNWGYYLTSLKTLCETGTGLPFERARTA